MIYFASAFKSTASSHKFCLVMLMPNLYALDETLVTKTKPSYVIGTVITRYKARVTLIDKDCIVFNSGVHPSIHVHCPEAPFFNSVIR